MLWYEALSAIAASSDVVNKRPIVVYDPVILPFDDSIYQSDPLIESIKIHKIKPRNKLKHNCTNKRRVPSTIDEHSPGLLGLMYSRVC